jgi:hypothetical protein
LAPGPWDRHRQPAPPAAGAVKAAPARTGTTGTRRQGDDTAVCLASRSVDDDVVSILKADPWVQAVLARGRRSGGYEGFCRELDRARRCAHPICLAGVTGDGSSLGSEVWKPCGNRRTSRCPACAQVHREDARHLVRAGLCGGKGVPTSVWPPTRPSS